MMRLLRRFVPLSGPALALWAWHHRDEVLEWSGFGVRAARKLASGDRADIATEARVRVTLQRDRRTRDAPGLRLEVRDGVAYLGGLVEPDVRALVPTLVARSTGVERVDDRLLESVSTARA